MKSRLGIIFLTFLIGCSPQNTHPDAFVVFKKYFFLGPSNILFFKEGKDDKLTYEVSQKFLPKDVLDQIKDNLKLGGWTVREDDFENPGTPIATDYSRMENKWMGQWQNSKGDIVVYWLTSDKSDSKKPKTFVSAVLYESNRINEIADELQKKQVYVNDFENQGFAGEIFPEKSGDGLLKEDTKVIGSFAYPVRTITYPNGKHGIRFTTKSESPGGYDYSMQVPMVIFQNRFVQKKHLLFKWTVYLPKKYDNSKPSHYWDHRYLFRYYDASNEFLSMRFVNNSEIGFYVQNQLQPQRIILGEVPVGDRPYNVTLDIEFSEKGKISATFNGREHTPVTFNAQSMRGSDIWINSPGNALLSDDDLDYFGSIDKVSVFDLEAHS